MSASNHCPPMSTISQVADWLQCLEDPESGPCSEYKTQKSNEKERTRTPERIIQSSNQTFQEISPTDTSFSGASIFDSKSRFRIDSCNAHLPIAFNDNDALSDITSISDHTEADEHSKSEKTREPSPSVTPSPPASTSHEPSPALAQHPNAPQTHPAQRIVNVLSCLQCTLANLPCSRKPPSCTRCIRNASTPCLLYRRRFTHELQLGATTPVLLKLRDEDQHVWRDKLALAENLYERWLDVQDKRNWVLPAVESERREGWCGRSSVRQTHPGEGLGRLKYLELDVDEEVVVG